MVRLAQAEPYRCRECGAPISIGDTYYRYMVSEQTRVYSEVIDATIGRSRKRVLDESVCVDCHRAALQALIGRKGKGELAQRRGTSDAP